MLRMEQQAGGLEKDQRGDEGSCRQRREGICRPERYKGNTEKKKRKQQPFSDCFLCEQNK